MTGPGRGMPALHAINGRLPSLGGCSVPTHLMALPATPPNRSQFGGCLRAEPKPSDYTSSTVSQACAGVRPVFEMVCGTSAL